MLIQNEDGSWEHDWPLRTEDPEEERSLRKGWNTAFSSEQVNVVSPYSFSYPSRIIRKEGTDG